jgi:hypothetical protein
MRRRHRRLCSRGGVAAGVKAHSVNKGGRRSWCSRRSHCRRCCQ